MTRAPRQSPSGLDKVARHTAIRRVIRARRVATQEHLRALLADEGIAVTQATLSRDLAQLGALRVSHRDGGAHYELEALDTTPSALADVAEMVVSVEANDVIVVVVTRPGAAPAVASAVDRSRLPECLGTLAGDDTIFLTPVRGVPARRLCKRLRHLFGLGDAT